MFYYRLFISIILYSLLLTIVSFGQGLGPVSGIRIEGANLILDTGSDEVRISALAENVVRINYLPYHSYSPNTLVLDAENWSPVSAQIDTTRETIVFATTGCRLEISRNPLRIKIFDGNGILRISEPDEGGLNENGVNLDVSGVDFYGVDNRSYGSLTSNAGGTIGAGSQGGAGAPFIWTPDGWGMIVDSDSGKISLSGGSLEFIQGAATKKNDVELFFIFGTPAEIFKGMTVVTGSVPMPPKFTFGFMNTEWGLDETELLSDVATYRTKKIPIDA